MARDRVEDVVERLTHGTPIAREEAAGALRNLAYNNEENKAAIAAAFEKHVNAAAAAAGLRPSAGSAHPGSGSAVPAVPSAANSIFGASASASGNATFGILESNGTGVKAGASTSDLGLGTYGTVDAGSINTAASSRSMKEDEANFMRIAFPRRDIVCMVFL